MTSTAFWIDRDYDYDQASDGHSRYAAYIRRNAAAFTDAWDYDTPSPAAFASAAWRVATGPIMAPGYVRSHERIHGVHVARNDWDGSLVAEVIVATGPPAPLTRMRRWRGWQAEFDAHYLEPDGQDLAHRAYMLTTTRLLFPLPADRLPTLPADEHDADLTGLAAAYVEVLVDELNTVVGPVLAALEATS